MFVIISLDIRFLFATMNMECEDTSDSRSPVGAEPSRGMFETPAQEISPDSVSDDVRSGDGQSARDAILQWNRDIFSGPPGRPSSTPERQRGLQEALLRFLEKHRPPPTPLQRRLALLDDDLLALSIKRALERIAVPLGQAAKEFIDRRYWKDFGHARAGDYSIARLGRSGRWLRDQAALGRAVERHWTVPTAVSRSAESQPV
jgi:hypothetical protein